MTNYFERYKERFDKSYEKILHAYEYKSTDEVPFIVSDVSYWMDGENPNKIPADYFTNPETMTDYQLKKIDNHLERYEDDYIPMLFPWYGTGVIPSALGCNIQFHEHSDPSVEGTVLKRPEDIRKLSMPDPYKDGLMPKVLETIDYMKAHTDLPVSFTDPQGPLNIALCLCGVENLFIWMYEAPKYVHEIMAFSTEVFINWVKVQKKHMGRELNAGAFPHGILLPEAFGGIWLADDDCTIMSAELYKEFVVPYNATIFKAFGGGTLHFCGSAEHQLENILHTDGCTGVNNFCMGNFKQIYKMQALYEDKLALMVCDFAPLHVNTYYKELFSGLRKKGTIVASFLSEVYALNQSKYDHVARDTDILGKEVYEVFQRYCR